MPSNRYLILGAGRQGTAAAYDLLRFGGQVRLVDTNEDSLVTACHKLGLLREHSIIADLGSESDISPLLNESDGAVLAADYALNPDLTRWAIRERCHTVDYGGNHDAVAAQHELNRQAGEASVAIVPDTGLTPGLAGILVAGGIDILDVAKTARIRVGGLPQDPKPPLNYSLLFSVRGLTNEYLEPSVVIINGKRTTWSPLNGLEELEFDGKTYEAFYTSGGVSTLPESFGDRLVELDCKTIRYPGHARLIRFAFDIGFGSEEPVEVAGREIVPREVFEAMLVKSLPHDQPDVTLMRVTVSGELKGAPASVVYEMTDRYDSESGFTSMQRTTAWPGTIVLQQLLDGKISQRGVLYQERVMSAGRMITELEARGVHIDMRISR